MDEDWISRAANGDQQAFTGIVEQFKGYLLAVILPIVRDPDQAQDVLQETFWQVYRSLPGYRGGNFKIWLARIATHKAIDWRRRQQRHGEIAPVSPAEYNTVATGSAENEALSSMAHCRLADILRSLPPPYRATVTGYLLEGKSYRQLADEAGITVRTVESRLYRARQILKEKLKES